MATAADERAMQLYLGLMQEAKARAFSVNAISGMNHSIPVPLIREYCFLQLRMLCELIALGCLVAHGDITNTKYFQREAYKADDILNQLERLHPNFYSYPFRPVFNPGHVHMDDVNPDYDFLKKVELIKLYSKCGAELHKGRLTRIVSPTSVPDNFDDIQKWGQKVLNLLSVHRISRIGGNFHLLSFLHDVNGNVAVAIAESPKSLESEQK